MPYSMLKIEKYVGEQILALDAINMTEGFILHSYEVDETELKKLIKNTAASILGVMCFVLLTYQT